MTKAETEAVVNAAVVKALTEAGILKAAPAQEPTQTPQPQPAAEPVQKEAAPAPAPSSGDFESAVEKAVVKALVNLGLAEEVPDPDAPVTKVDVESVVQAALAPMLKAFSLSCHFHVSGFSPTFTEMEPNTNMTVTEKLSLPAGTDVRLNDKIVDLTTGVEYTAGIPRNIRDHHMVVQLHRREVQKAL